MAKKQSGSLVHAKQVAKRGKHISDKEIDFSDIPESSDAQLARAKKVGRPRIGNPKQLIAIRIDPELLNQLRKLANKQDKPYQTLIHELLKRAAKKAA